MNNLRNMIFIPNWKKERLRERAASVERCVWVVFESCKTVASKITELIGNQNIIFLKECNDNELMFRMRNFDRVIFIAKTDWTYKTHDNEIVSFLNFVKEIQLIKKFKLDIVSIKSIVCPLYGAPIHPCDAVFVGLGQTLAQEADCLVRVFVLEDLSESSLRWLLQGEFPQHCPLIISKDYFLIPSMKRSDKYNMSEESITAFRKNGRYLIIGGNGGLGGMMARYLAEKYQANLILIGRSSENISQVEYLKNIGAQSVEYKQADVGNFQRLNFIFSNYININGIIHSALILKDSLIINLLPENLLKVLEPKLQGALNLLRILKDRDCSELDFVLFFSSIQSYIANPGQANYTAACVAKDALAAVLNEIYMVNTKVINWSFWGQIGIVASDSYRKRMSRLGIASIEEDEGLQIIEWFLSTKLKQITVIKATDDALKRLNIEV